MAATQPVVHENHQLTRPSLCVCSRSWAILPTDASSLLSFTWPCSGTTTRLCTTAGYTPAVTDMKGLTALARAQHIGGGVDRRGACKRCGGLGHRTNQCRNVPLAEAGGAAGAAEQGFPGSNMDLLDAEDEERLLLGSEGEGGLSDSGDERRGRSKQRRRSRSRSSSSSGSSDSSSERRRKVRGSLGWGGRHKADNNANCSRAGYAGFAAVQYAGKPPQQPRSASWKVAGSTAVQSAPSTPPSPDFDTNRVECLCR
jgi:hypothetical protein